MGRPPGLILATYRDDEAAELPGLRNRAKVIKLNRLSKDAMADLSTSMLGQSGHFPEMIDFLQRETEGNVFFAVEIVRALAEEAGEIEKIGTTVRPTQITAGGI